MDKYITLQQASDLLPTNTSVCTLWRWCTRGIYIRSTDQVIRLEHMYVGRKIVTTKGWIELFLERVSTGKIAQHRAKGKSNRKYFRIMQLVEAEAVLRRAGI